MRLRIISGLGALAGFAALIGSADKAEAQCHPTGCQPPPPPCCEPPPPPPPPPPPSPCCEQPPPPTTPPGGNLNVNVNVNAGASADGSARALINARAGGTTVVGGGGGAYFTVEQPYPTTIQGLNVEGARTRRLVRVPYEERRASYRRVVIQAVCIDDRAIPHPASQVRPDREVHEGYEGELYRCIAGTRLQWTWAEYLDRVSFEKGETKACQKGEALWFGQGHMECRPQKQERDCNERSLLRRYGAGIKILSLYGEEVFTAYREEWVEEAVGSVTGSVITLDGGVGGRVF